MRPGEIIASHREKALQPLKEARERGRGGIFNSVYFLAEEAENLRPGL